MWHFAINSNMNFPAAIAAVGFLAACCGTLLSVCALAVAAFIRKRQVAQLTLFWPLPAALVYFGLLFGFSLASRDHLLAHGQEKYFCEIDCHLAYSVTASENRTCRRSSSTTSSLCAPASTKPPSPLTALKTRRLLPHPAPSN